MTDGATIPTGTNDTWCTQHNSSTMQYPGLWGARCAYYGNHSPCVTERRPHVVYRWDHWTKTWICIVSGETRPQVLE